jgi:hypothetical protein
MSVVHFIDTKHINWDRGQGPSKMTSNNVKMAWYIYIYIPGHSTPFLRRLWQQCLRPNSVNSLQRNFINNVLATRAYSRYHPPLSTCRMHNITISPATSRLIKKTKMDKTACVLPLVKITFTCSVQKCIDSLLNIASGALHANVA